MSDLRAWCVRATQGNSDDRQCQANKQGQCDVLEPGKVLGFHAADGATWNG